MRQTGHELFQTCFVVSWWTKHLFQHSPSSLNLSVRGWGMGKSRRKGTSCLWWAIKCTCFYWLIALLCSSCQIDTYAITEVYPHHLQRRRVPCGIPNRKIAKWGTYPHWWGSLGALLLLLISNNSEGFPYPRVWKVFGVRGGNSWEYMDLNCSCGFINSSTGY